MKTVSKLVPGCIVYCDLGPFEHSGIYLGNNSIAHFNGEGVVEIVNPYKFVQISVRILGNHNIDRPIYVSCKDNISVGSCVIAERVHNQVGDVRNYNLLFSNCHNFCSKCITNNDNSSDVFLWQLKNTTRNYLGANEWLVWDLQFNNIGLLFRSTNRRRFNDGLQNRS